MWLGLLIRQVLGDGLERVSHLDMEVQVCIISMAGGPLGILTGTHTLDTDPTGTGVTMAVTGDTVGMGEDEEICRV